MLSERRRSFNWLYNYKTLTMGVQGTVSKEGAVWVAECLPFLMFLSCISYMRKVLFPKDRRFKLVMFKLEQIVGGIFE